MKATEREAAIIAAYRAGRRVVDIEEEFGVGRSTIYHFLRRAGQVPERTQRRTQAKDAALAELYGLIDHQARLIAEQEQQIIALRRRLQAAERKAR